MRPSLHRSGDDLADRRAEYAEAYAKAGDTAAAADLMAQAVERAPNWLLGRVRWGEFLAEAGETEAASAVFRQALARDEADPYGISLKLARLGAEPVPDAPSPSFVAGLFDQYADGFEDALVRRLEYRVPDLLSDLIDRAAPGARFAAALDLGCGTGLMGERLKPLCDRLDGIDLSAGMLEKARRKRLYDTLLEGDILAAPRLGDSGYDLVTAADVLTYLGDLRPVFAHTASLQDAGGWLAFSTERAEDDAGFVLRPSLRYAHSVDYLEAALQDAGYAVVNRSAETLRRDRGEAIAGTLVVARKR
ncbi:class I SAM-dependent DNA methyltransferase [Aureimonas phyllosphaerae]|uniref:Putative TPR repeat methyltransferase n=1 Tax=Aureimonas phyllosphaerae TaxID=1166078 RepID=A0A7W6BX64_9HYPH|nr:methyltransferase [Aureimonas phyllosphaerae]MBB3934392.1 putative TPR repeat methyltransferase [Aureimonas phyllosphaerae]MBB3958392.1 putative TPR repeat methyltransferase [Aureimonas phyllosphaerae]SFE96293.1 Predicted methyltransferase, contains TPR repeat [Aureimonas phyllosphaerae]